MIVVFDTNVWIEELGLRSPSAAVVRFYMRQKGAKLALPEVVRLEVQSNLRERLLSFIDNLERNHRLLLTAFGSLHPLALPGGAKVDEKIAEIFSSVDVETIDVPFSLESARSSFIKTIQKTPPSDKSQQFKDGVLWADCAGLLAKDDVILVTPDKAFYQNRNYSEGLASSLAAEISASMHRMTLLPSVSDLLGELRREVVLDDEGFARAALEKASNAVADILRQYEFELRGRVGLRHDLFITETPHLLFTEYWVEFACADSSGTNRPDAVIRIHADGMYDTESATLQEVRNREIVLVISESDGSGKTLGHTFLYASAGGGPSSVREVSYQVRQKVG